MINAQTKVGLLILAAIIVALGVVVNLGKISIKKGYEFYVLFDDIADLPARPAVKISGVVVGRVNKIELYKGKARIKMWIAGDVKIHKDTNVKILKMGMIGNTYVSLTEGTEDFPLIQQGDIIEGVNPLSYEQVVDSLVSGLNEVVRVFQKIGEKDMGENISQTFANLKELSGSLNTALGKDGRKLAEAMDNINSVMSNLDSMLEEGSEVVNVNIEKLGSAADELRAILVEIRQGKGAAGKILISEEYGKKVGDTIDSIYRASRDLKEAVNRFKGFDTTWDAGIYYAPEGKIFRSYSGLTVRTSSERFLNIGLENMIPPDGTDRFDPEGDRINALTVKAGKKFGNFTVFGGAIRSSGGFGANWLYRDILRVETELFDFRRANANPWWNFSSKLRLVKFLSVGVSFEDILENGSFRTGLEIELK